ncbi:MAG TPA: VgrG-related protein [Gaiellales bacterium]
MSPLPLISGVEVTIDGDPLDSALAANLLEVRADQRYGLPAAFLVRIADPQLQHVDSSPLAVGASVDISLAAAGGDSLQPIISGQITAVEPEFGRSGAVLAARGYDAGHALNRSRTTETYQNMSSDDIASKVADRAGVDAGQIDSAGDVHDFVQQNNETDWEFLWRLARRIDFQVGVDQNGLNFKKASADGDGDPPTLTWGADLWTFRPRVTGVQQVDEVVVRSWDPASKDVIESRQSAGTTDADIGIDRGDVGSALGGGSMTMADRPVLSSDEADALATSMASRLANAYVEAEGTCRGNPGLSAGVRVQIDGVGQLYGGVYTLSAASHTWRVGQGYETRFAVTGRSPRSLVDLLNPAPVERWGGSVVVGIVTQNSDPDDMGRVRVRYPALGDDIEGWWARIASPAAGSERGLLMMPVAGDEVLVAFEHGDVRRPYVLGALWNGSDQPGDDLVQTDGSFALRSDHKVGVHAADAMTFETDSDLEITAGGKHTQKSSDDSSIEGQNVNVKANSSLTIEATGDLTIKGASITVQASGTVTVSGSQVSLG